jgi:hypothetical protein
VTNDPESSIPARHGRKWQGAFAPLRRGLTWLGSRPPTARLRRRFVLPAAFIATALVAGAGGFLVRDVSGTEAEAAGSTTAPAGPGTGGSGPGANQALDARAVLDRLVAAGLPITNPVPVDKSTDPNDLLGRPGGYTSRLSFSFPGGDPDANQYGIGRGGIIEVFATASDAKRRADSIRKQDNGSGRHERHYRAGPVLVRLLGSVDRSLAAKVRSAMADLAQVSSSERDAD